MDILERWIGCKGLSFYINLDNRVERKENAERNIRNSGLFPDVIRFPAVYWKTLDFSNIPFSVEEDRDAITIKKNTVALSITTLSLLNRFISDPTAHFVVIFEDDIFFNPNFSEILEKKISLVPDDWNILVLGGKPFYFSTNITTPLLVDGETEGEFKVEQYFNVCNTQAYIIRDKHTAQQIIDYAIPFKYQWDAYLGSLTDKLNMYNIERLTGQDNFTTDLQNSEVSHYDVWMQINTIKTLSVFCNMFVDDKQKATAISTDFIVNFVNKEVILLGDEFIFDRKFENRLLHDVALNSALVALTSYLHGALSGNLLNVQNLAIYLLNIFCYKYITNYADRLPLLQKDNAKKVFSVNVEYDSWGIDVFDYYTCDSAKAYDFIVSNNDKLWWIYKSNGSYSHL